MIGRDHEALLKGEHKKIAVLFLDIRDFTKLSQQLKAEDVVTMLNAYFGRVVDIIQGHNGFVNKFIGDGLLAFFATEKNPVADAIAAAMAIDNGTRAMHSEGKFPHADGWSINIGIGIHYGDVIIGNIGSTKKMDFTIIGSPVNIASRVESLTKTTEKTILLTQDAYEMVRSDRNLEYVGEYTVKGVDKPIKVYSIT